MSQPAFDPAMFGGPPSTPPVPMVVCWDDLPPDVYTRQLGELLTWIGWLRTTYRVPATVIPPCWFMHPGIREDVGHLWTGWLLTRHPDAGVGMIGLDWDQRREAAINRLREATAVTGCTATRHQAEPMPTAGSAGSVDELWESHLNAQAQSRARVIVLGAAFDQALDILQSVELRHDLAPVILGDIAHDPAAASVADRTAVAEGLRRLAVEAIHRAAQSARDAARTALDAQQHTSNEAAVCDARDDIADALANASLNEAAGSPSEELSQRWLDALEKLLPAAVAAERAAAAAAARVAAVDQRAAARRRHPKIDDLLA